MNFRNKPVTLSGFELKECALQINRVELDQEYNGEQIPLNLTKKYQIKKISFLTINIFGAVCL